MVSRPRASRRPGSGTTLGDLRDGAATNVLAWAALAALLLLAYVLGSAPIAIWLARRHGVNIMAVGTRNPGAANVFRSVSKVAGAMVLAADVGKGALPVAAANALSFPPWASAIAGLAALVGHWYPALNRFQGGQGLATALGITVAMAPTASLLPAVAGVASLAVLRSTGHAAAVYYAALVVVLLAQGVPWWTTALALLPGLAVFLRSTALARVGTVTPSV